MENIEFDDALRRDITLRFPVTLADRELLVVTMRRPTMGDLLDHEPQRADDVQKEVELLGILCSLKKEEMRLLDPVDYAALQEQYLRFRVKPKT